MRSQIRSGDPDAFGALFDEHATAVYNHAFRLTGNWSTAEDVMALTYLEAWRLRNKIQSDGGSLRPWLLGIATNIARNTQRARRRYEAALSRLPPLDVVPDFAQELADRIDDAHTIEVVNAAMASLRQAEREVVALCVWSGLDYAATADALGIPVGTVRSRLARARKKLTKAAQDAQSDHPHPHPASHPHSQPSPHPHSRSYSHPQTDTDTETDTELVRGGGQLKGGRAFAARQIPEETP